MKKWILAVIILLLLGGLGMACSGSNSYPTGTSNGTPVPHGGGGGY